MTNQIKVGGLYVHRRCWARISAERLDASV